jgi:hypothetical protein
MSRAGVLLLLLVAGSGPRAAAQQVTDIVGSATIVGAVVGWAVRSERWELVSPGDVEVGLGPVGRGGALGGVIRF